MSLLKAFQDMELFFWANALRVGGSVDSLSALVPAMRFPGHLFLQIKAAVNIQGPETNPKWRGQSGEAPGKQPGSRARGFLGSSPVCPWASYLTSLSSVSSLVKSDTIYSFVERMPVIMSPRSDLPQGSQNEDWMVAVRKEVPSLQPLCLRAGLLAFRTSVSL